MFAQDLDEFSFKRGFGKELENPYEIRMAVRQAQKYVLDYNASRQLVDLAYPTRWPDMAQLRQLARSPVRRLWVESNNVARRGRLIECVKSEISKLVDLNGKILKHSFETKLADVQAQLNGMAKPDQVVPKLAWLIETHEKQPSAHRVTIVIGGKDKPTSVEALAAVELFKDVKIPYDDFILTLPFAWYWDTEDNPNVPWGKAFMLNINKKEFSQGNTSNARFYAIPEIATGITGCDDPFIGLTKGYAKPLSMGKYHANLAKEFSGELRYVMSFLASLSSTMVEKTNTKTNQSRVASGRVLPAFEYTEVRIKLPKQRKLADYIVRHGSSGIKKRDHAVERFWRTFEHGPGPFCTNGDYTHSWELGAVADKQYCKHCPAWRTWVKEHRRGAKNIGVIEHVKKVVT